MVKMQKRARSEEQREARKRVLLDAALEQFHQHGYADTTVAMITRAASLSTGTFYLYFQSKVEIFSYLYNEAIDILKEDFQKAREMQASGYLKLLAIAETYKRFYRHNYAYFRVLGILHINQEEFHNSDLPINRRIDENARELLMNIALILEEGMNNNEFRELDPWVTTTMLWAMFDGFFIMQERKSLEFAGISFEEILNQGFALFSTSLLKQG